LIKKNKAKKKQSKIKKDENIKIWNNLNKQL
jgi:hypothetical protein